MNTAPCNCEMQTAKQSVNEHPRYYARQLVTPDDMTLEHDYLRAKLRRHNRYLHGWGVVCGAIVELPPPATARPPWKIIVKAGYILGPYGDEICIEKDQCLDVRKLCLSEQQTPQDDFECGEVQPTTPALDTSLFVVIRYVESKTRLIRVPLGGCGCEDNACEYSRLSDGYEICILDHCPNTTVLDTRPGTTERIRNCPECPAEPWVGLGEFEVNRDGIITLKAGGCRKELHPTTVFAGPAVRAEENAEQIVAGNTEATTGDAAQPAASNIETTPGA